MSERASRVAPAGGFDRRDLLVVVGLLVVAALLRLPDLATRGTWEADQGHDMLVLRSLVRDGIVPLLGPPTSIGDVHHGAWYYYLLSPAALLTGGSSPLAVVGLIALVGVAAVAVVWWLGRAIGGRVAGLAAGAAIAISTAAVDESTFIWNPNLIGLSSAVALAGAWRAWSGGRPGWWIVAAIGTAVTMQCHVLGAALLPVILVPFLLDGRRRPLGRIAVAWVVVFAIAYLPLIVNELTTDFSETRAALDYLAGGREGSDVAIPVRFGIVGLRVVSWPLVGLITDGFVAGVLATAAVVGIVAWRWRAGARAERGFGTLAGASGGGDLGGGDLGRGALVGGERAVGERVVAAWFGFGLLWSTAFLTVAAPSLASVVPGLPNDHYHAFADPMVFVIVGLGVGAALRLRRPLAVAGTGIAVLAFAGWNLTHLPPSVHPDGGFPAGRAAGERVDATLTAGGVDRSAPVLIRSLPDFKSTEAMAYPLALAGRAYVAETPRGIAPGSAGEGTDVERVTGGFVLLCDDRFAAAIGAACGGEAEGAVTPDGGGTRWGPLLDRFEAQPDRWVSVYGGSP